MLVRTSTDALSKGGALTVTGHLPSAHSIPTVWWLQEKRNRTPGELKGLCENLPAFASLEDTYKSVQEASALVWEHYGVRSETLFWAVDMVLSRAFRLSTRRRGSTLALLPLVDMLDHSSTDVPVRYGTEGSDFVMTTTKVLHVDDPVLGYYGPKTSWNLLKLYGFVPDVNIHHAAELFLDRAALEKAFRGPEDLFNEIAAFLSLQGLLLHDEDTYGVKIRLTSLGNGDGNLLATCRGLCIWEESAIPSRSGLHQYLSKENELCARELASSIVEAELDSLRTLEAKVSKIALAGDSHERHLANFVRKALQHDQAVVERFLRVVQ